MHQMMLKNNVILVYEGEFTQEITKSVLAMAERNMDSVGEESGIKRKVFNVMVECLQNIVSILSLPNVKNLVYMLYVYIRLRRYTYRKPTRGVPPPAALL